MAAGKFLRCDLEFCNQFVFLGVTCCLGATLVKCIELSSSLIANDFECSLQPFIKGWVEHVRYDVSASSIIEIPLIIVID